ncbi:WXG100 family type VII secretion target [Herpetosiphon giganteus]|uniref:WXG100 family type VII secretion target n=1 Tax=Herpetosiphon giganteus TaxID=2029754 RepID=UPI0019576F6C|nr:WXG100 family type VII secretion target [Herpetosiphon giganteus]MBM7842774.1 WXG100 family type VII secretion target [Herpetosiphon giganteus]
MAAETVQIDKEVMAQVAQRFGKLEQNVQQLFQTLNQLAQKMQQDWVGDAAAKYQAEWQGEMTPAFNRLIQAFNTFQSTSNEIKQTFQQHEDEAAAIFKAWKI